MEKRKMMKVVHGEIHLHEAIIQHIQSFLSRKEAAQTSILSKSWYSAWATRPIVDLDQRHFQIRGGADEGPLIADEFLEYSKKTMRRYKESNLNIESFRFYMKNTGTEFFSVVNELIVDAIKLGACDLNVELKRQTGEFYLPYELLRSENLVRLSVSGCRIDLASTGGKLGFPKLKSLSLRRVCMVGFWTLDIVSTCPLIEELVLCKCNCICRVRTDKLPVSRSSFISMSQIAVDAPIRLYDNLKCLYLDTTQIDEFPFNNMSTSFPCMKDLALINCWGFNGLQIFSPSLEVLSIAGTVVSVKFDVPSLRKFSFSGSIIPDLSIEAASREWESDISITNILDDIIRTPWLDTLKNFLMKLSLSKISLSLCLEKSFVKGVDLVGHVPSLPIPEVENLKLCIHAPTSVCSKLLKCVFWVFRPKFILAEFCIGWGENSDMPSLLHKTLTKKGSKGCRNPRHMFDKYGLEKVDAELFEDSVAEWRPLPWKALVGASKSPEKKQKIRFKLGWSQNTSMHLDEIL